MIKNKNKMALGPKKIPKDNDVHSLIDQIDTILLDLNTKLGLEEVSEFIWKDYIEPIRRRINTSTNGGLETPKQEREKIEKKIESLPQQERTFAQKALQIGENSIIASFPLFLAACDNNPGKHATDMINYGVKKNGTAGTPAGNPDEYGSSGPIEVLTDPAIPWIVKEALFGAYLIFVLAKIFDTAEGSSQEGDGTIKSFFKDSTMNEIGKISIPTYILSWALYLTIPDKLNFIMNDPRLGSMALAGGGMTLIGLLKVISRSNNEK